MEREDPLEKLERKELENKSNGGLKTIMIVMTVVALALAAALVYVWMSKNSLVDDLNGEKQDLTEQIRQGVHHHRHAVLEGVLLGAEHQVLRHHQGIRVQQHQHRRDDQDVAEAEFELQAAPEGISIL